MNTAIKKKASPLALMSTEESMSVTAPEKTEYIVVKVTPRSGSRGGRRCTAVSIRSRGRYLTIKPSEKWLSMEWKEIGVEFLFTEDGEWAGVKVTKATDKEGFGLRGSKTRTERPRYEIPTEKVGRLVAADDVSRRQIVEEPVFDGDSYILKAPEGWSVVKQTESQG